MQLRDIQEELVRKDTELHKMEVDLVSADEERKRLDDQVSSSQPHDRNISGYDQVSSLPHNHNLLGSDQVSSSQPHDRNISGYDQVSSLPHAHNLLGSDQVSSSQPHDSSISGYDQVSSLPHDHNMLGYNV